MYISYLSRWERICVPRIIADITPFVIAFMISLEGGLQCGAIEDMGGNIRGNGEGREQMGIPCWFGPSNFMKSIRARTHVLYQGCEAQAHDVTPQRNLSQILLCKYDKLSTTRS